MLNVVPIDLKVPGQYIGIDNSKAYRGLTGYPTRVVIIGQKLAAGSQPALTPVMITNKDQPKQYFGVGSQLTHMLEKFIAANSITEVWAIAQEDNAAGAAAVGAIKYTGPSTAAGTINLYIGGRRVQVGVGATDTAAQIATKTVAAIAALPDLAVTSAVDGVDTSKVNLTCRHKGDVGNSIDIRVNYQSDEAMPSGVGKVITAMTGGTANPDVSAALATISAEWFTDFVFSYTDLTNIGLIEADLKERFGPTKMIDAHAFIAYRGTHSSLVTKGNARNSHLVTSPGLNGSPTPPYEEAAIWAAVSSYHLDLDPARPLQTLVLPGLLPPAIPDRFTFEERNILLNYGIATSRVNADGTVSIERAVTNYKKNAAGAVDPSYLDIEVVKTVSYLRFDIRNFIALTYPRYKLADDGTNFARGENVVTPSVIKASLLARFRMWEAAGLVEKFAQFKTDLIVVRNKEDVNRVNAIIPPDVINQLRIFDALVQYRL